jgi:AcrR family transcriptional regulator
MSSRPTSTASHRPKPSAPPPRAAAAARSAVASPRPARPTRAQQRERTREALVDAAVQVVGEHGYAGASVTAITRRAGVAQGTFYNYFDSREDLFDRLLPTLARTMLERIRQAELQVRGRGEQAREEAGLRAYFEFLRDVPHFYRILYEAEIFAPAAHRAHIELIATNFARVLGRARRRGEIGGFNRRELEPVVYMLMGARHYLSMRHAHRGGRERPVPDWVVKTYMKLIRGLYQA